MSHLIRFSSVTFSYDASSSPIIRELSLDIHPGFLGISGLNGAGKTTFLKLASGLLTPDLGSVIRGGEAVYCEQKTDRPPEGIGDIFSAYGSPGFEAIPLLGIEEEWTGRWDTLSHGERKKLQIAKALSLDPDILALDEPTNHVDEKTRKAIIAVLSRFRGIGLLVSHDRELMDSLCTRCLFLKDGKGIVRPGGISAGLEDEELELKSRLREYEEAKRSFNRLKETVIMKKTKALSADKKNSKRGLDSRDSDGRARINGARNLGKDGKAGKDFRILDRRLAGLERAATDASVHTRKATGVTIQAEAAPKRSFIARLPSMEIPLGKKRRLAIPELAILPNDRIALTGENGSGKSSLVAAILKAAKTQEGLLYLPQELGEEERRYKLRFDEESDAVKGEILSAVSRLGSDPSRIMGNDILSPGETRKLMIAYSIAKAFKFIVLDEPTNHMDIASVRLIEEALAGYTGALLTVSHDRYFLDRIAKTEWNIRRTGEEEFSLLVSGYSKKTS